MSVFARNIYPNISKLITVLKPTKTKFAVCYLTGSLVCGGYLSYKDGLKELEEFRTMKKNGDNIYYTIDSKLITTNSSDIRVAKTAFYQHLWSNINFCALVPFDFAVFLILYHAYGLYKKNGIDDNDDNNDNNKQKNDL